MKDVAMRLFEKAFLIEASDLYIFPCGESVQLSFRLNQKKLAHTSLSYQEAEKLILYLKYLGNMDVGERRKIQIGAAKVFIDNRWRHIRISTVANFKNQESLVIRFLHYLEDETSYRLLQPDIYEEMSQLINQKGLFLFSGVTGSGKTTTMYRLAKKMAAQNKQVITIEDPVELEHAPFLQLQVNKKINLHYDELIQVCLRHRPDIMIVGEIRDEETAKAVVRGALTGHTILTTIHGLNKHGVLARLLDLGVNQEDLRQCLKGVIYQRLVPVTIKDKEQQAVWFDPWFIQEGCWKVAKEEQRNQQRSRKLWALGYFSEKHTKNVSRKKISKKKQQHITHLTAELLSNGFTLQESLNFLRIVYYEEEKKFGLIQENLAKGEGLAKTFSALDLSEKYLAQIHLGQVHGDLAGSFKRISKQLQDYQKQQANLIKVLFYPVMLLFFLGMMIVLMKFVLLPQMNGLTADNLGIWFIEHSPQLFCCAVLSFALLYVFFYIKLKKRSAIEQMCFLAAFPIVKIGVKHYCTSFFSYEWGKLLIHGVELKEIFVIMQEQGNTRLMQEMGATLAKGLQQGEGIAEQIARYSFFSEGFSQMIHQGELKGKLGLELLFYGETLWEDLLKKIEKYTNYLQPLIFLVVGLLIVTVYAALLLPIYQNMEAFL